MKTAEQAFNTKLHEDTFVTYRACGSCFSMDVFPYMGFETGQQYECKGCGTISSLVVEFETLEALEAFRKAGSE